ncbi:MAG: hypothetical protein IBX71_01990 [Candidatus Desulforudis sp.]|nr:hypothetical protein [Desulforudis sp.]
MELKDAILRFHQGEMIKTLLINAGNLSTELLQIEASDRAPAIKMYKGVLEQIRGEIRMTTAITGSSNLAGVDGKIREAIWEVHINRPEEACRLLGEAISGTVSSIQRATERLKQEGLI